MSERVELRDLGLQDVRVLICTDPACPSYPELASACHAAHDRVLVYLRAVVEEHSLPGCDRQMLLANLYASLGGLFIAGGGDLSKNIGMSPQWEELLRQHMVLSTRLYRAMREQETDSP